MIRKQRYTNDYIIIIIIIITVDKSTVSGSCQETWTHDTAYQHRKCYLLSCSWLELHQNILNTYLPLNYDIL